MSCVGTEEASLLAGTPVESLLAAAEAIKAKGWIPATPELSGLFIEAGGVIDGFKRVDVEGRSGWSSKAGVAALVAGWVIEHLEPVQSLLDKLVGDGDKVRADAATLAGVAARIGAQSDAARAQGLQWNGMAGEAEYRLRCQVAATSSGVALVLAELGEAMNVAAAAVDIVRGLAEDAMADLLASIAVRAPVAVVPVIGTAATVAWAVSQIAETADRVKVYIDSITTMGQLLREVVGAGRDALQEAHEWLEESSRISAR